MAVFYLILLKYGLWIIHFNIMIPELDERMRDLKNELQSFEGDEYDESHKRKAMEALKRMESWNLFSDTYEVCLLVCLWVITLMFSVRDL